MAEENKLQTMQQGGALVASSEDMQGTMTRPEALDPNDRSGTEDITLEEIQLPRLAIAQGLSPQVIPTEGSFIRGLVIGEMFNDVTGQIYGNGPLTVVPVKRHITRIEFDPNDRKVPLDRNVPAGDPRLQWDGDNPPCATEFVEFVCLLLLPQAKPEKVIVSIKTTNKYQRQAARLWRTLIKLREGPICSGYYHLCSKLEKGKTKDGQDTNFGVFVVKNAGYIKLGTPYGDALFAYAKEFMAQIEGKEIVTEREAEEPAGPVDTSFDTRGM
ncbi:MAG: hypothetical protein ABFD60_01500 [Bryobacteraceae bacterium]